MPAVIQFRRDTAANWTSNNPTLASGEMGVETDTNKYKVGDGSTAWTSLTYSSLPSTAISNTTFTTKGDILGTTAASTIARLAVGTDTYVLTADSAASTGLAWASPTTGDITGVTTAANSGMAGGETSGDASISVDANNLSSVTAVSTDYVVIEDVTDNTTKKALVSDIISAGDITGVTAGTLLDGGGLSGTVTLNVDLSEASTSTTDGDGDFFLVVDSANAQYKLTKANIALSGMNNDSGWTTNTGDIEGVTAGTGGVTGGGTSGTVTINLDTTNADIVLSAQVFG